MQSLLQTRYRRHQSGGFCCPGRRPNYWDDRSRRKRSCQIDHQPHKARNGHAKGEMLSVDDVLELLAIDLIGLIPDDENVISSTNLGNACSYGWKK